MSPDKMSPDTTARSEQTEAEPSRSAGHYLFSITADAHPGMIERVLAPITKRGLTPRSMHLSQDGPIAISLSVDGLTEIEAEHISLQIGQYPGVVRSVHQAVEIPHRPAILSAA